MSVGRRDKVPSSMVRSPSTNLRRASSSVSCSNDMAVSYNPDSYTESSVASEEDGAPQARRQPPGLVVAVREDEEEEADARPERPRRRRRLNKAAVGGSVARGEMR